MITRFKYNYSIKDLLYSIRKTGSFENDLLKTQTFFGTENIFFTVQGRVNLRIILNSLNLKKNATIGVQAYNCSNVFDAIRIAGFRPFFIDVDDNYVIDVSDLKNKIKNLNALIVTHTFGIPADIDDIKKICAGKPVIEDCAHSLFSTYNGRNTGSFFDASVFSIGYGKYPSIGKGGFSIINNNRLLNDFKAEYELLKKRSSIDEIENILKNYFMAFANNSSLYSTFFSPIGKVIDKRLNLTNKYGHIETKRFNSNAWLFDHSLNKYTLYNDLQRRVGKSLVNKLKDVISCIDDSENKKLNFYIFPLRSKKRDIIVAKLLNNNIESGKHFANSIESAKKFGYKDGMCPNSEKIVSELFTIPCNYSLKEREINKIVGSLKESLS